MSENDIDIVLSDCEYFLGYCPSEDRFVYTMHGGLLFTRCWCEVGNTQGKNHVNWCCS